MSGAVPAPAARPLEWAARVPRPVCPGCGRCGRGDPAPAPQRAPLRAGVARCGGGGRASPGGVPSTIVRGVCGQALSLPRLPAHWAGCGVRHPCAVGAGVWVCGPNTVPLARMPCGGPVLPGWWGAVPRGGWPATIVRGAWCQALSLPRPPVLWSGQPGFRVPCVPGAVGAGVGTRHRPQSVRTCGRALLAVGVAEGRPRGGCVPPLCEGRLRSGAVPPPTARQLGGLLGSATHVLWARVCWCGGPTPSPQPGRPVGAACRGGGGGPSPGGVACHHCEGRLPSDAVPPPAARPLERAARVPRPVCPGCGRCGRGDPAPAPQRAPLRAGVARCGGGGRASPGGVPSTIV